MTVDWIMLQDEVTTTQHENIGYTDGLSTSEEQGGKLQQQQQRTAKMSGPPQDPPRPPRKIQRATWFIDKNLQTAERVLARQLRDLRIAPPSLSPQQLEQQQRLEEQGRLYQNQRQELLQLQVRLQ
ncbi:MAG: hypothetical protein J3Q66DRAFT_368736 [Benniella sp.]|nr:MAG: hypothetical protein J3Q66DRAFT_368736 [Benniella sp.]